MAITKKLRVVFYALATLELVLLSALYGWGRVGLHWKQYHSSALPQLVRRVHWRRCPRLTSSFYFPWFLPCRFWSPGGFPGRVGSYGQESQRRYLALTFSMQLLPAGISSLTGG